MPVNSEVTVFQTFPVLHTERLDLIEIKQRHLNDLFKIFGNPAVTSFYNVTTLEKEAEAQQFINHFRNRFNEGAAIRWGLALKGCNTIIGTLGYNNFTKHHRANIGYDLLPEFWNNGYITEALKAVLRFGFDQLYINRIEAEVMQGNVASERVLEKLGFKKEGVLRQWMYWNNKHFDMNMFSLLRSDAGATKTEDL